ncbi:hypothetical protein Pcinc_022930 [Petrolisthes cinctipes]|uniref:Pacifastin domain-containing protein n=1 Tax=Petrolisthes cinctipes TaxID=88211 RepID=A0AAE1FDS3_PETCI|nr:hypothetical protein Pcinc_022930 [Petrolisthes cinctipes]
MKPTPVILLVLMAVLGMAAAQGSCVPGTSWKQDCNTCFCTETGVGVCTLKLCATRGKRETPCEPNSTWMDDCNRCRCANGVGVCTKKACSVVLHDVAEAEAECQGEEGRWREACNWCRCVKGKGVCTRRGCPSDLTLYDGTPDCEGTASWNDNCNTCHCSDGRAVCTAKLCLSNDQRIQE